RCYECRGHRTVQKYGAPRIFLYRYQRRHSRKVLRSKVPRAALRKQRDCQTLSGARRRSHRQRRSAPPPGLAPAIGSPCLPLPQPDRVASPANIVTLTTEVGLPPDIHVYAPGTRGYKPINLQIDAIKEAQLKAALYPHSKILYMPAIKERVPVYEGTFRIRQDVQVPSASDFSNSLGTDGKTITLAGKLEYQACDSQICFLPNSIPVHWQLQVLPLDRQRAPENIQHK